MNELNRKRKKERKRYIFMDNLDEFGINKLFISRFLTSLWNCPEAMYKILINSDPVEIQTNLAPLIVNNFYINYLSGNYIENNLLYILTLMIKDEIEKLEDIDKVTNFLDNTRCGYLLEELQKKADIQLFFNKVIVKIIEDMENKYSSKEFLLNLTKIDEEINKIKNDIEKGDKKKKTILDPDQVYKKIRDNKIGNNNLKDAQEKGKIFAGKYLTNIEVNDLEKNAEEAKNNNDLSEYYLKFVREIKDKNNKDIYSNENFMNSFQKITSSPETVLIFYQNDFFEIKEILENIINSLLNHLLLLPYSVKCLCKIISVLIRNKFKNITKTEENGFIAKFFFGKLFIPIIKNPGFNALISEFVISGNTIKNINIINIIINKLFSGNLFKGNTEEMYYTPFNWFFLDKMKAVLSFFENCTNAKLPSFIEKFINNELPQDYKYNYFNENKDEFYANISICFNINSLIRLIEGIKKCPEIFNFNNDYVDKLKKSYERLNVEDTLKEIIEKEQNLKKDYKIKEEKEQKEREEREKEEKKQKNKEKDKTKEKDKKNIYYKYIKDHEIILYFLHKDKSIDSQYEILFKLNNSNIANFYIDIKEEEKKGLISEQQRILINVKNYLSITIGNYRLLNIADFQNESTSDLIKMLNEIKEYIVLPNFIINNNTVPSSWYMDSLLDYLDKLPQEYKNNDFDKLFKELEEDINESIDILDFQRLIMFRNKLKFIDKMSNYYDNVSELIDSISINEKIKILAETENIPVEVDFKYIGTNEKENRFKIKAIHIKDIGKIFECNKTFVEDQKKNTYVVRTMEAFTAHFPDLTRYQLLQDKNPLEILREIDFLKSINNYFEIIKERIIKNHNANEEIYARYSEKIKDYIMNKLYDKIYPPEYAPEDTKIFKITTLHSWIEPQMIIDKKYTYDNILPDILNKYKQIHIIKNPFKKIECIRKIFELIHNLIKFNENKNDNDIGSDDTTPILMYTFIKAHPQRIYSDIEFVKIFLPNTNQQAEYDIAQFESAINYALSLTADKFKLTKEEYQNKCENFI